jgi:hypothetical protein
MTYTQVVLTRPLGEVGEFKNRPYMTRAAWIPTKFAKVGRTIRLHDEPEVWTVATAGSHPMDEEFVQARRDDYRYQRRVSDI